MRISATASAGAWAVCHVAHPKARAASLKLTASPAGSTLAAPCRIEARRGGIHEPSATSRFELRRRRSVLRRRFLGGSMAAAVGSLSGGLGSTIAHAQRTAPTAPVGLDYLRPAGMVDEAYWATVRKQFNLVDDVTYMNNGTLGPMPHHVFEANVRYLRDIMEDPRRGGMTDEVRQKVGELRRGERGRNRVEPQHDRRHQDVLLGRGHEGRRRSAHVDARAPRRLRSVAGARKTIRHQGQYRRHSRSS